MMAAKPSAAHPIVPDGNAMEWLVRSSPSIDQGLVVRDREEPGEWVWTDRRGDARGVAPDDLTEVRVHANLDGLGFMLRFAAPPSACLQAQIALDVDRVMGSGAAGFINAPNTLLSGQAGAEAIVVATARGASVHRVNMAPIAQGAGVGPDGLEIFVPWSSLGLAGVATGMRATLAIFCAPNGVQPQAPMDGTVSEAVDTVTDYGGFSPVIRSTLDEVQDRTQDHFVDWYFGANGGLVAPLGVQRVAPSVALNRGAAWFDLRVFARENVSLNGFAFGNEATPGGPDGLVQLPDGLTLRPGESVTVAMDGARFLSAYTTHATVDVSATDPMALAAIALPTRARGSVVFDRLSDEVVVVDARRTVTDVVTYGAGNFAGVLPIPRIAEDTVFTRIPGGYDIDDGRLDFVLNGTVCGVGFACAERECSSCTQRVCLEQPDGRRCTQLAGLCGTCFIGACGPPMPIGACPEDVASTDAVIPAEDVLDERSSVADSSVLIDAYLQDVSLNDLANHSENDVASSPDAMDDTTSRDVMGDASVVDQGGSFVDSRVVLDRPFVDSAVGPPQYVASGGCACSVRRSTRGRSLAGLTWVLFGLMALILSRRAQRRERASP